MYVAALLLLLPLRMVICVHLTHCFGSLVSSAMTNMGRKGTWEEKLSFLILLSVLIFALLTKDAELLTCPFVYSCEQLWCCIMIPRRHWPQPPSLHHSHHHIPPYLCFLLLMVCSMCVYYVHYVYIIIVWGALGRLHLFMNNRPCLWDVRKGWYTKFFSSHAAVRCIGHTVHCINKWIREHKRSAEQNKGKHCVSARKAACAFVILPQQCIKPK